MVRSNSSADAGVPTDIRQCAALPPDQAQACFCTLAAHGYELPRDLIAACPTITPGPNQCCYSNQCCTEPQVCLLVGPNEVRCIDRPSGCNGPIDCSCFTKDPCTGLGSFYCTFFSAGVLKCGFQ
jgi:hypothetical protein